MAEVATQAAKVPETLRTLTQPLASKAELEAFRKRLDETRGRVDGEWEAAGVILRSAPTLDVIQSQQQLWQRRELQFTELLATLTQRATLLQRALDRLTHLKTTWRLTRDAAAAARAPAASLADINGALRVIEPVETLLTSRRAAVLELQSLVAQEVTRSTAVLAQFSLAQEREMGGILIRDSPPVWSAEAWKEARATWGDSARDIVAVRRSDIARYFRDSSLGMPEHALLLGALTAVFLAASRRLRRRGAHDDEPLNSGVVEHPFAAAMLVVLFFLSSPLSDVPQSVRSLSAVLMLVPALQLTRSALDPRLRLPVYVLAALFTLDSFREMIGGASMLEQALLSGEMVAGSVVIGVALTRGGLRRGPDPDPSERLHAYRVTAELVVIVLAAGLMAALLGYMRLARLVASALLGGGALALTLHASLQIATGIVAVALRVWPLHLLRMVQNHRDRIERRVAGALLWLAVLGWTTRLLDRAALFQPAWSLGTTVLGTQVGRGSIAFSVGDALEFVLTIWIAYLLSRFLRFVLSEDVYPRTQMKRGLGYALSSLLNYIILTLGFLLGLGVFGFDLTRVTVLAGALGVGIGFGLQSIVNNFVSGLILLFERPIRVGDVIEVGDVTGEVTSIGIRASTVRTVRGAEIVVPNAQLATERVTNWTLADRRRRIDVAVGVDYGSAPGKVVEVLEAVARAHPEILKEPPPMAVFTAFADSAITFELRAWTADFEHWPRIQTDLATGVHAALRGAGITIPFPQREVRVLGASARPI
jgi:small-conductance mechanosensitive channel